MRLYQIVVAWWFISELLIGIVSFVRRGKAGSPRQDRWSGPALIVFLFIAIVLGANLARRVPAAEITPHALVFGLGIAIAVLGIIVRGYAVISLGRFFTTRVMTQPGQMVVERGPYRWIRHPSYTGALLTVLGILLCQANWLSLACFPLALPGFAYRISVEESALTAALGDAYRDYMRRTKRLVPFVV
jgi:protein-S-isoprenylcysteine O-methyltransferase Ste14